MAIIIIVMMHSIAFACGYYIGRIERDKDRARSSRRVDEEDDNFKWE